MPPGEIYVIAVILTTIFVAPFNRLAMVIVVSWYAGHVAWLAGAHEGWTNLVQHGAAAIAGFRYSHRGVNSFIWSLFAPMVLVDALGLMFTGNGATIWSVVLVCAALQLVAAPFGMDWNRARKTWRAWRDSAPLYRIRGDLAHAATN